MRRQPLQAHPPSTIRVCAHRTTRTPCIPRPCPRTLHLTFSCASPQSYKAGWASPLEQNGNSPFNGTFTYDAVTGDFNDNPIVLPAMGVTDKNHLRIVLDQTGIDRNNARQRALYVSYR